MKKTKILSVLLILVIFASLCSGCKKADPNGIFFDAAKIYYNQNPVEAMPHTFEATLLFPKDFSVENLRKPLVYRLLLLKSLLKMLINQLFYLLKVIITLRNRGQKWIGLR